MSDNQHGKPMRIRDIAEILGVSTATVSNVIHNKTTKISAATIERVQKALDEYGYTPNMAAISLAQKRSPVVGIVVGATGRYEKAMLTDPFISHMLDSISLALEKRGYSLMLCRESDIHNVPRNARMWNWAGAIFMAFPRNAYDEIAERMPVPFLAIDSGSCDSDKYATSTLDNYSAGYQAGECLIKNGHTRIAYLADSFKLNRAAGNGIPTMRYYGMADAIKALAPDAPEPVVYHMPNTHNERLAMFDDIHQAALRGEITAIFSMADLFAIELVNHLTDAGAKMPDLLSVISFDDIESSIIVRPRLTTFHQDLASRGQAAADLLLDMVENKCGVSHIIDSVQLVIRDSIADISK